MKLRTPMASAWLAASLLFAGCGGGGGDAGGGIGGTGSTLGTLRLSITDAPACGYDAVNITVEKIRVHRSDSASDGDGGWHDIVLNPPQRIDLLSLSNGVLLELGQLALPAGMYTQLRLVLAGSGQPLANSVIPSGGAETPLTTPSAQQSGLKLKAHIDVPAGQVVDFVIDFDACRSVLRRGNSGHYNLKPVVSVIAVLSGAGQSVTGHVAPALAVGSTLVSLQFDGVPVKATVPDATGRFVLYPVSPGRYNLVVGAQGRVSAVVTGVPVVDAAPTVINPATLPIDPPAASQRLVAGVVSPADASVRALQTLSGGPTVEIAWAGADELSGAFAMRLPIDAPVRTDYAAIGPFSLGFAADGAAAGRYSIEAAHAGAVLVQAVDVTAAVQPVVFDFP